MSDNPPKPTESNQPAAAEKPMDFSLVGSNNDLDQTTTLDDIRAINAQHYGRSDGTKALPDIRVPIDGPQIKAPGIVYTKSALQDLLDQKNYSQAASAMEPSEARKFLPIIRELEIQYGYNLEDRFLGYGTGVGSRNNPLINPNSLFQPNPETIDLMRIRNAWEHKQPSQSRGLDFFELARQSRQGKELAIHIRSMQNPFGLSQFTNITDDLTEQQITQAREELAIAEASPEQRAEYARRQMLNRMETEDPYRRYFSHLEARLKKPISQLTPEEKTIYERQLQLLRILALDDELSKHIDNYYQRTSPDNMALKNLSDALHLFIYTGKGDIPDLRRYQLSAKNPNLEYFNDYLPILVSELSFYPPEVIDRTGLRQIILCQDLKVADKGASGCASRDGYSIYFDVEDLYDRLVVHHELMHIIDKQSGCLEKDPKWAALNKPNFTYKVNEFNNGESALDLTYANIGFLDPYSTTHMCEDKAMLFGYMMTDYNMVNRRAKIDPIIRAKMAEIKKRLKEFSPFFDDALWSKLNNQMPIH